MQKTCRVCLALIAFICGANAVARDLPHLQPAIWSAIPDAAAFEKLENERIARAQRTIDQLATANGPRTVDNTLSVYDEAIAQLDAAQYLSTVMEAVHPDPVFRDHATEMTRKVSAAQAALSLNRGVYHALAAIDVANTDAPTRYYVQRQLLEFRLAGVDQSDSVRARLKILNDELTAQKSLFDRNMSDAEKSIEVRDPAELAGVPQDYLDSHKPGNDGIIRITTRYPDYIPIMTFASSDALRRRLFLAFVNRAYPQNHAVLLTMLRTRHEIASLLGYKSWADYSAADKMIGGGERIGEFIDGLDHAVRGTAEREFQMLLAQKRKSAPQASTIEAHEKFYLQEQVRRASYDFDSQSVRRFFPYTQVKQGILDTAASFFHVTFQREPATPAWEHSVETWLVIDAGKVIGRFYLDMHPRTGKYTHAEMAPLLDGIRGKQLPEAILICNLPEPNADDPGLMGHEDVETIFHEFGHMMHMILGGQVRWAGISGISMEQDFVEAPSQMLEELIRSPQVLAAFARDYQSGQPISAEVVMRMNRADAFGRASYVSQQNAYAALSYDLHHIAPQDIDPDAVGQRAAVKYTLFPPLAGTHMYASFDHLSGYSSEYYKYMWDQVIAVDFYAQFNATNPFSGGVPLRYRRAVLEPGGSVPASELVRNFLGRPQSMEALQRWIGVEFVPATH